jgi:hypothetical protein
MHSAAGPVFVFSALRRNRLGSFSSYILTHWSSFIIKLVNLQTGIITRAMKILSVDGGLIKDIIFIPDLSHPYLLVL